MSDGKSVRKRFETLGRTTVQTLSFGNRTVQLLRGGILQYMSDGWQPAGHCYVYLAS
jgi:hypothetical protein